MSAAQCGLLFLLFVSVQCAIVLGQQCKACAAGSVSVQNGAYYDILVVVENGVSYDPNIVPNIQSYFQEASDALFTATKDHSGRYFGEVTILLPEYWPEDNTIPATTEAADKATFSVRPDSDEWGSNPYTVRVISDCGTPGQVTVLPESFTNDITEAQKYGNNIGKTILHEWAHLRYGLFDESSWEDGGDVFPCSSIQDVNQVPRCSSAIDGTAMQAEESGMCIFIPDVNQTAAASLLYAPYIDSVDQFCDDEGLVQDSGLIHNKFALNQQNQRCHQRSAWSVMRDHPDFAPEIVGASRAEIVNFRIVRDNTLRISIVMDVSGSMATNDRITWMRQSVENFLRSLLRATMTNEQPIMVGLTKFSTNAQKIHDLVFINETTIDSLIAVIPSIANGATSIGAGIRTGLEVLETPGLRSMVIVFTDGEENTAPYIVDVEDEVCEFNATVYGMIASNVAANHPLITLSTATCGGSCVVEDTTQTTIYDCLWDALQERAPALAPIQLIAEVVNVPQLTNLLESVVVDAVFTNSTMFRFEWTYSVATGNKCNLIHVNITTPDGTVLDSDNYNPTATLIEIPGSSTVVGEWYYDIVNPSTTDCDVRITVEGDTSITTAADQPVQTNVLTSKSKLALNANGTLQDNTVAIYVQVIQGSAPVIGANVKAIVTLGAIDWVVPLLDNGASADLLKDDGIYSRYFTDYNSNGAYSIRVEVVGVDGKVKVNKRKRSYGQGAPPLPQYRVLSISSTSQPTSPFQRSAVGGAIDISGYSALTSASALFPPSQIADLVTSLADTTTYTVTIMWTAVGAYLDQGNASSYDIRISMDPMELLTAFDQAFQLTSDMIANGSSLSLPLEAGLLEQMLLDLTNTNFTSALGAQIYVAIVAINENGRRSPISNLGQFIFDLMSPTTTTPTVTPTDQFPGWAIALIVIGCLLLVAVVVIAVVLVYKKTSHGAKYGNGDNTYVNGPGVYMHSPPAYDGPQRGRINDEKV